jgi:signal transduction histidine kinase/ligand-binding sensor domain-containing protein
VKRFLLALFIVAWSPRAFALNASLDVSQYAHAMWKNADGFMPWTIYAIAQTPDGYLWLGTESGLVRFDGVTFSPWQPPANQVLPSTYITALSATPDGALWIGTDRGLAMWDGRTLRSHDRLADRYVGTLLRTRDGTVWLISVNRATGKSLLCAVASGAVTCSGEDGGPGADAIGLHESRDGTLWVGTRDGVWLWKPAGRRFFPIGRRQNGIQGLYDGDDGSLHVITETGVRRLAGSEVTEVVAFSPPIAGANVRRALRDRDGSVWMESMSGVVHVRKGRVEVFTKVQGLSADRIYTIFEDREGNIWVATSGGLDRFSDAVGATVSSRQGLASDLVNSVLVSRDGSIWAATAAGVQHLGASATTLDRTRGVTSVFEDQAGRIWAAGDEGVVGLIENGRLADVAGFPRDFTRSIVEDSDYVWVVNQARGIFRMSRDAQVAEHVDWNPPNVSAAAADPRKKGIWVGFGAGGVAHYVDGRTREAYSPADGVGPGRVRWLSLDGDGTLWIATEGGLSRLQNGRIATWNRQHGLPCDTILWMIDDGRGALWLSTSCGLLRVDKADLTDSAAVVHSTTFDSSDGVRTHLEMYPLTAPVIRAGDGRIWFVAQEGLGVIDPKRLAYNRAPPSVQIEHVIVDHKEMPVAGTARATLPALTRDVEISYTALSLVAPEKNRFRYKLDGYDSDWQDAGHRRQAFYSHLPPRTYRFRVIASNNSGVWNEAGAALEVVIPPAYYQTTWFAALVGGVVVALVWGAHRVRLRIVERHEREISALNERLMKAQEQERIRIAGELHDGVMQQMLAVTMMLGTTKRKAARDADIQASIEKIQQKVIQAGTDIRQLSHGLHPPLLQEAGLPGALRSYCEQFGMASNIAIDCALDETARDLSRGAALALFRITQEAIGNAVKHANAKHITVHLARVNGSIALTISDDGIGFDRNRLSTSGGLGLVMMRERAGQLNGTFDFDSAPGRGTRIRVVIPFR